MPKPAKPSKGTEISSKAASKGTIRACSICGSNKLKWLGGGANAIYDRIGLSSSGMLECESCGNNVLPIEFDDEKSYRRYLAGLKEAKENPQPEPNDAEEPSGEEPLEEESGQQGIKPENGIVGFALIVVSVILFALGYTPIASVLVFALGLYVIYSAFQKEAPEKKK